MSGEEAESGLAKDVYDALSADFEKGTFEVLAIPVGSPEAFMYPDEYLAIECEDKEPIVFFDGVKVSSGTEDIAFIMQKIKGLEAV